MTVEARARFIAQHERFGGINWGAAFFGWLSANGLAVLVLAAFSGAGLAIGLTTTSGHPELNQDRAENGGLGPVHSVDTIGIVGGAVLLLVLAVAYFAGGYVAGRMSRFDGARQGFAVWLIGLFTAMALAAAVVAFGAKYNVLAELDLPRIPVDEGTATRGGVVALAAVVVITAIAAVLGGKAGEHYHRKIDRVVVEPAADRKPRTRIGTRSSTKADAKSGTKASVKSGPKADAKSGTKTDAKAG
jgi:hypothetical protein